MRGKDWREGRGSEEGLDSEGRWRCWSHNLPTVRSAPGDDVFRTVSPGERALYEYDVPTDHMVRSVRVQRIHRPHGALCTSTASP